MKDLVFRPLTASEEPLFESLAEPALVGPGASATTTPTGLPAANTALNGRG